MRIAWCIPCVLAFAVLCATAVSPVVAENQLGPTAVDELEKLPVGLKVTHYPNPCLAIETDKEIDKKSGNRLMRYAWRFKTTISPVDSDVKVTEFGGYQRLNGKWFFTNITQKPFTSKEFADWYSCPDALVKMGNLYSDPESWITSEVLGGAKLRWYYIGTDATGRRVRGDAVAETKAELDPAGAAGPSAEAPGRFLGRIRVAWRAGPQRGPGGLHPDVFPSFEE
jgi:hypothetical protein